MRRLTFPIKLLVFLKPMTFYMLDIVSKQVRGWLMAYLFHEGNRKWPTVKSSWMVHLLKESWCQGSCEIFISCCKFDDLDVLCVVSTASSFSAPFLFLRHPGLYFQKERVSIYCTLLHDSLLFRKFPHLIWPQFPTTHLFLNPLYIYSATESMKEKKLDLLLF